MPTITATCPNCGRAIVRDQTQEFYCDACQTHPFKIKKQEAAGPLSMQFWTLPGWSKGPNYYNLYFDAAGFHSVRLDSTWTRFLFGGAFWGGVYQKEKRWEVQQSVLGKPVAELRAVGFKLDTEFAYEQIEKITYTKSFLFGKKLTLTSGGKKFTYKADMFWKDPVEELKEIPGLQGKLVLPEK